MPEKFNPTRTVRSRRTEFSTRALEEGGPPKISGYFVVFNEPYYIWDDMEEVIMPGAFDNADTSDVRALTDHLTHLVLGRSNDKTQTLTWSIDDKGLWAEVEINEADTDAVNLHARVQRGDVDQASFGFDESAVMFVDLPDGRVRREIHGIAKLWEISVCTFPAYEQTSVCARSRLSDELTAHRAQAAAARKARAKSKFKHKEV